MRFEQIEWHNQFNGIWACASLLHVSKAEMADIWHRLIRALKPSGAWFVVQVEPG